MSNLLNVLSDKLTGKNVRIVLPEGEDARVLTAAVKLQATDLVAPIVLGNEEKLKKLQRVQTYQSMVLQSSTQKQVN